MSGPKCNTYNLSEEEKKRQRRLYEEKLERQKRERIERQKQERIRLEKEKEEKIRLERQKEEKRVRDFDSDVQNTIDEIERLRALKDKERERKAVYHMPADRKYAHVVNTSAYKTRETGITEEASITNESIIEEEISIDVVTKMRGEKK